MKIEDFVNRAGQLIKQADSVLTTTYSNGEITLVNRAAFSGFRTGSLSFIKNLYGESHPFYKDFDKKCDHNWPDRTEVGKGILTAIHEELKGGFLTNAKGLVSAEIFSDFLEMAKYLIDEHYKDPAAVIIGSVLEEHLRQLCSKNDIPITVERAGGSNSQKTETLNSELSKKGIYNKLDQKSVTAWLALRNNAAHGKYGEYTKQQVEQMHQWLTDFMVRNAI